MELKLKTLGSSSKGNCYIIKTKKEYLIIECGVKLGQIQKAVNFDFKKVSGCLVTHEHKDHSAQISNLTRRSIDVYATAGTFLNLGIKSHRAKIIEAKKQFKVGGFTVLPFEAEHDAIEPVNFLIKHREFGTLLFITDSFYCRYKFKGVNYLMIECNHSRELLEKASADLSKSYLDRLYRSHFSLENVIEFIKANDWSALKEIHLMHLSFLNADKKKFVFEITKASGKHVFICE